MDSLPLDPETADKLEEVARRTRRNPADLGNAILLRRLTEELEDLDETARGVERAMHQARAGQGRAAHEVFADLRRKYNLPDRPR